MVTAESDTQTDCLTPEQAAERLQVSRGTILFWLRTGRLVGAKLGYRTWRITSTAIQEFLGRQAVGAAAHGEG